MPSVGLGPEPDVRRPESALARALRRYTTPRFPEFGKQGSVPDSRLSAALLLGQVRGAPVLGYAAPTARLGPIRAVRVVAVAASCERLTLLVNGEPQDPSGPRAAATQVGRTALEVGDGLRTQTVRSVAAPRRRRAAHGACPDGRAASRRRRRRLLAALSAGGMVTASTPSESLNQRCRDRTTADLEVRFAAPLDDEGRVVLDLTHDGARRLASEVADQEVILIVAVDDPAAPSIAGCMDLTLEANTRDVVRRAAASAALRRR